METGLYETLTGYGRQGILPMHMPCIIPRG